ncbi:endolytic transglycosylase MltG [Candidatus Latescibacterota bacterium]
MITVKTTRALIASGALILTAAVILILRLESVHIAPDEDGNLYFEIEAGMSAGEIADRLHGQKIIGSPGYFKFVSKLRGYSKRFKAGNHVISGAKSVHGLARLFTRIPPSPPDIKLTIVEGLNLWETASVLSSAAGIDSTEFIRLASDKNTASELKVDNDTLEGYLYPDTYFVVYDTTPREIIARLVGTFNGVFTDSLRERASEMDMNVNEVVTLASIIETEAQLDEDRAIVSQVFHRRLSLNRPLEANPTVQYAMRSRRRVLDIDLEIDSPYNTYKHRGLPPGPIASPGKKSIIAALYPADTKYLYFMADGNGGHVFSRSLNEHNRAVRNYKRERSRAKRK